MSWKNESTLIHPRARRTVESFKSFPTKGWNIHIRCRGEVLAFSDVRQTTVMNEFVFFPRPQRRVASQCLRGFPESKIKAQSFLIPGISRVKTNNLVSLQSSRLRSRLIFPDLFTPVVVIRMTYSWAGVRLRAPSEAALPFISTRWSLTYGGAGACFRKTAAAALMHKKHGMGGDVQLCFLYSPYARTIKCEWAGKQNALPSVQLSCYCNKDEDGDEEDGFLCE